jgi:hypothetical protein
MEEDIYIFLPILSKKSGLKPRLKRRKVFGTGIYAPLQKHPTADRLMPPAFVNFWSVILS